MRDRTQRRIEEIAAERSVAAAIDLAIVEAGIEDGRKAMEEMIKGYQANPAPAREVMERAEPARVERVEPASTSAGALPLNEVGIMAAMEAKRRQNPTEH